MKKLFAAFAVITLTLTVSAFAQAPQAKTSTIATAGDSATPAPMTIDSERFRQIVAFHGHTCAGLAMGVRVAQAAARELGSDLDPYNLVAIVETNRCPVDAIQVLLHTTAGKQNLIYQGHNRNVFTFVRRSDGKAIRITVKDVGWGKNDPVFETLREKKNSGKATPKETRTFNEMMEASATAILNAPEDQLLTIEQVKVDLPRN